MALDSLHSIVVFVRVAEARSFTLAARRLGISQSGVSRAVSRLEQKLGVRLVARTTRSVRLTEEGAALLASCRHVLAEVEDAEALIGRRLARPAGRLRLQMPIGFGRCVVAPLLTELRARYPDLVFDIELSDRAADLVEEGLDAVIRIGELTDSRLIARKLCDIRYVTVASPAYLARHGEPRTPQDLADHACLAYFVPFSGSYRDWDFSAGKRRLSVPVAGTFNVNNAQMLLDAAIAGAGITAVASFIAFDAVKAGQLELVLRDHAPPGASVSLVYAERRYQSPRVRVLVDFLTQRIAADPWWEALTDGSP